METEGIRRLIWRKYDHKRSNDTKIRNIEVLERIQGKKKLTSAQIENDAGLLLVRPTGRVSPIYGRIRRASSRSGFWVQSHIVVDAVESAGGDDLIHTRGRCRRLLAAADWRLHSIVRHRDSRQHCVRIFFAMAPADTIHFISSIWRAIELKERETSIVYHRTSLEEP